MGSGRGFGRIRGIFVFGGVFLGLRKSEVGDWGWELWRFDAFGSRIARASRRRVGGDLYVIRLARVWGAEEWSLIDSFVPGEGVAECAFDFRMAARRYLADSLGQGRTRNGPYVVAVGHAFRGQAFGAAQWNFDRDMADGVAAVAGATGEVLAGSVTISIPPRTTNRRPRLPNPADGDRLAGCVLLPSLESLYEWPIARIQPAGVSPRGRSC